MRREIEYLKFKTKQLFWYIYLQVYIEGFQPLWDIELSIVLLFGRFLWTTSSKIRKWNHLKVPPTQWFESNLYKQIKTTIIFYKNEINLNNFCLQKVHCLPRNSIMNCFRCGETFGASYLYLFCSKSSMKWTNWWKTPEPIRVAP